MKGLLKGFAIWFFICFSGAGAHYEDFSLDARSMGMANTGLLFSGVGGLDGVPSRLFDLRRREIGFQYGLPWSSPDRSGYFGLAYGTSLLERVYGGLSFQHRFIKDTSGSFGEDCLAGAFSYAFPRMVIGVSVKALGKTGSGDSVAPLAVARFPERASAGLSATVWPGLSGLRLGFGVSDIGAEGAPSYFWSGGVFLLTGEQGRIFTPLVSWNLGYRDGDLGLAVGAETWLWNRWGLRGGSRIAGGKSMEFSFGTGFRTLNMESTDWEIDYALIFPYDLGDRSTPSHWLGLRVWPGDAYAKDKAKALAAEQEALLLARERRVDSLMDEIARLRDEIAAERARLEEERARLEKERQNVEKMRQEALEALQKIEGLKIEEQKEFIKITAGEKAIRFASGSADLPVEGIIVLKKVSRFLASYPKYPVSIEGHTDNVPISERLKAKYPDNQALSEARAKAVRDYFVLVEGLPGNLFTYKGYGESKPVASNDSEEGRSANRRVEIIISKPKEDK
ncbi:MAG: OmpA family protein [candidate division WOR-3 bacterium]